MRSGGRSRHRGQDRTPQPTPLGEVIDGLLATERRLVRGIPIGRLAADWAGVVGPRLAAETAPVSLEAGALVVAASTGPWGAQAKFLGDEIRKKANAVLGSEDVKRVQIVVRPDSPKSL